MINKELFVETINFIKERDDAMDKINEVFSNEFGDSVFYPYLQYEHQVIKLLAASFDYDDDIMYDWISYYCFDLDFGRNHKLGDVTKKQNGVETAIPLGTPEELYDMLFKEACGYGNKR
jgi:hypothetical protein